MSSLGSASYASLNAREQDLSKRIAELARIDSGGASIDSNLCLSVYLFLFTTRN
jgi:hypothetical protein